MLGKPGLASDVPRATSCILVWLQGGLSHVDSFDPKPRAPQEFRGEFSAIPTRVPGIQLSEHLPRLALMQDKFSIVRGLDPQNGTHGLAEATMLSGRRVIWALDAPSFGAVFSHQLGGEGNGRRSVQLGSNLDRRFGGGGAGFLGSRYEPLIVEAAANLEREPLGLRESYGRHSLGQKCLHARSLIESGVRFVTVTDGGWDTHRDGFQAYRERLLPRLDAALSTLLADLDSRGRLDSTLVLVLSDFGRTPLVNERGGRDHWSKASVALLAGAGIRGGIVVGETDSRGESAVEEPTRVEDLAATVFDRLGVPAGTTLRTPDGRTVPICGGRLIRELV
jgi:hypothetical protein